MTIAYDILIVDDEPDIRDLISGILSDEGYTTRVVGTGEKALEEISLRQPSLLVLDVWLGDPQYDGLKILGLIKKTNPDLPIVMISGHGTVETAVSAIKLGAYDFIEKPFKTDRLLLVIERALETAMLRKENRYFKETQAPFQMVGRSSAMQLIRKAVSKVAPTNSRIFITGPVGVGKKMVARAIHAQSKRADGPFFVLHCLRDSVLVDELLFGKEATETSARNLGLLEQAHGGTLFLDEVTQLPLETQAKLVRFLQDYSFKRGGGDKKVTVDVRIITGTHQDIPSLLAKGLFREDLYYRLNVISLALPPLRDRLEDLQELVENFSDLLAKQLGVSRRSFSDAALVMMQNYMWPGNIRELRNVVERALILSPAANDAPVGPDELPPEVKGEKTPLVSLTHTRDFLSLSLREARESFEREYLLAQVQKFSGNISRTASFIGMERSALHRKLRQLSVDRGKSALPSLPEESDSNPDLKKRA